MDDEFASFQFQCGVCDVETPHYSVRFESDENGGYQWAECAMCRSRAKVYTAGPAFERQTQRKKQLLDMASLDVRMVASLWQNAKTYSKWPDDGTTVRQMIDVILEAEFPTNP